MRLTIIALILSIAALGLGSFATFKSLDNSEATPFAAQPGWSEAECETAHSSLYTFEVGCIAKGDCTPYSDMIQAIADNCP